MSTTNPAGGRTGVGYPYGDEATAASVVSQLAPRTVPCSGCAIRSTPATTCGSGTFCVTECCARSTERCRPPITATDRARRCAGRTPGRTGCTAAGPADRDTHQAHGPRDRGPHAAPQAPPGVLDVSAATGVATVFRAGRLHRASRIRITR